MVIISLLQNLFCVVNAYWPSGTLVHSVAHKSTALVHLSLFKHIYKSHCCLENFNLMTQVPNIPLSVGEPKLGAKTFYREPVKIIKRAGAVKPHLVGAGAGASKNPLKTVPGSRAYLEPESVKDIYSQAFFRGSRSREPGAGEKSTGSPTLIPSQRPFLSKGPLIEVKIYPLT